MDALALLRAAMHDRADLLQRFLALMREHGIRDCVIDSLALSAYLEPLLGVDVDLIVAANQLSAAEVLLRNAFIIERSPEALNVTAPSSDIRINVQTHPRYAPFIARSTVREVLGHQIPVAALEDALQGKVWAALDPTRRPSKRQKDLTDIARILEAHPTLRERVPQSLLDRLL